MALGGVWEEEEEEEDDDDEEEESLVNSITQKNSVKLGKNPVQGRRIALATEKNSVKLGKESLVNCITQEKLGKTR